MDPNFDELLVLIGNLSEKLNKSPRCKEILDKLKAGLTDSESAVSALFEVMREEGLLEGALSQSKTLLTSMDSRFEDMVPMGKNPEGKEVVNPLWEAALAERISLDGDVPELRHGPLPQGGKPAVPVMLGDCIDPVKVGVMLERASQEIQERLMLAAREHSEVCHKILAITEKKARESGADITKALGFAQKVLPEAPLGVPGYMAGIKPELHKVPEPTGTEMLALSDDLAQKYSHSALVTTQGRVSLMHPIREKVLQALAQKGLRVTSGEVKTPTVRAKWVVSSYGAGDFSPRFNYIESAIAVLTEKLLRELQGAAEEWVLEVVPFNGISSRTFGWEARASRM